MKRWLKRISSGAGIFILLALVSITAVTEKVKLPGEQVTPAGFRQGRSLYVTMHDGVPIAVSVWVPVDLQPGEKIPALMHTTRYWRAPRLGWGLRVLVALNQIHPENLVNKERAYFNQRRFAVVLVDARGSGASGGHRAVEYGPAEVADMGEVAAWIAAQPWSNGSVGTFGVSYDGNMAELAAVPNQPAIRAVMPLYDDLDTQALIQPGGVLLQGFIQPWSDLVANLDRNDVCAAGELHGFDCWKARQTIPGVRPADDDPHGKHLKELVAAHHNVNVAKSLAGVEFRDDALVTPEGAFHFADISPYGLRKQIEASGVPMMVWCGWLDADPCEGTLSRYKTFSNPQVVVIGPLSHGGSFDVDPFAKSHQPPVPSRDEQFKMEADFFERTLRNQSAEKIESSIHYYTMGEGAWHTTKIWPPAGLTAQRLYFAANNSLSEAAPSIASSRDSYTVDFTASSGKQTRWHTQLGGGDVVYPDRAAEDKKLLTYTAAPLDTDLEITGSPVLKLEMASTATDGAIHAYLEDVAPDGRVTYLDEGVFRIINRKEVDPTSLPYAPLGPPHSFLRSDAEPLTPGETATIRFSMIPTSLLLRKGHRIRLALAGADAGLFERIPPAGTPTWTVYRELARASFVELPVKKRTP